MLLLVKYVCIFAFRQERRSLQTLASDGPTHFVFLCMRYWVQLLGIAAVDSDTRRVMSHTWLLSATVVTPDHVWHGLVAAHGRCYKCNATAPSFHMASVWCRLRARLGYGNASQCTVARSRSLGERLCVKISVVVLLQHWFSQTARVLACIPCSSKHKLKQRGKNVTLGHLANRSL